jgi:putative radical SAM enzyme (TIGR03279 family)
MRARIKSIISGSVAELSGIRPHDLLCAINENSACEDLFDYQFAVMGETSLQLILEREGKPFTLDLHKEEMDDLGIQFESPVFTGIKTCNNACPFCFIDQQPEGLRPTLYVKDDDWRLSYFVNTYITLTNLTRHDRERIERIKPGPLYVSVHCTVPDIRERLLLNKKARDIMKELSWLGSLEIPFHAQVVICPGINDGEALSTTLKDLASLRPHCLSVAIVPVGLTDYRGELAILKAVEQHHAIDIIQRVEAFQKDLNDTDFVFASDEFYIKAQRAMPAYEAYGDFPQLDDGVGTARLLIQEFFDQEESLPTKLTQPENIIFLTGKLGQMILQPIVSRLNQIEDLFVDLIPVENHFWGEAVTVAGLITGQDILKTLTPLNLESYSRILIPDTMLKSGERLFLDGLTVEDLSLQLGCPIEVVYQASRAKSLLDTLFQKGDSTPFPYS